MFIRVGGVGLCSRSREVGKLIASIVLSLNPAYFLGAFGALGAHRSSWKCWREGGRGMPGSPHV